MPAAYLHNEDTFPCRPFLPTFTFLCGDSCSCYFFWYPMISLQWFVNQNRVFCVSVFLFCKAPASETFGYARFPYASSLKPFGCAVVFWARVFLNAVSMMWELATGFWRGNVGLKGGHDSKLFEAFLLFFLSTSTVLMLLTCYHKYCKCSVWSVLHFIFWGSCSIGFESLFLRWRLYSS